MKTVTFSNDQANAVRLALRTRVEYLERLFWQLKEEGVPDSERMSIQDHLNVARQALALIEA